MDSLRCSAFRISLFATLVVGTVWCAPSFAQERYNCGYSGCTLTTPHTHGGGSNASSAVNEYEAFRIWRERTGRKDATYQEYLDWRDARGGRDVDPGYEPEPQRRPTPPDTRRREDRTRPRREVRTPNTRQRRPRQTVRTGPLHKDCRSHLNGYDRFTEFPCILERACKKCPTTVLFYASSYEFDKYDRLDKIRYHRTICPNCRYENRLTIRLDD